MLPARTFCLANIWGSGESDPAMTLVRLSAPGLEALNNIILRVSCGFFSPLSCELATLSSIEFKSNMAFQDETLNYEMQGTYTTSGVKHMIYGQGSVAPFL